MTKINTQPPKSHLFGTSAENGTKKCYLDLTCRILLMVFSLILAALSIATVIQANNPALSNGVVIHFVVIITALLTVFAMIGHGLSVRLFPANQLVFKTVWASVGICTSGCFEILTFVGLFVKFYDYRPTESNDVVVLLAASYAHIALLSGRRFLVACVSDLGCSCSVSLKANFTSLINGNVLWSHIIFPRIITPSNCCPAPT